MRRPEADGTVYDVDIEEAQLLPTSQLAMILLGEIRDVWHLGNWFNEREQWDGLARKGDAALAWGEAWAWLRQNGLVIAKPTESSAHGVQLSRLGREMNRRIQAGEDVLADVESRRLVTHVSSVELERARGYFVSSPGPDGSQQVRLLRRSGDLPELRTQFVVQRRL